LRIKFLGTHNAASKHTKLMSFVVDGILAVDAGSLTSLTFAEQSKIKAILISHGHYDHIVEIPNFAFNNSDRVTEVFATRQSLQILSSHLMDGTIYPDFTSEASFPGKAVLRLVPVEPLKPRVIQGYRVTASLVRHSLSGAVGFEISSSDGKSLFYTGDTGTGLSAIWKEISPQLLITDTTFPNRLTETAEVTGHLCPEKLKNELMQFNRIRGYIPRVAVIHMFPQYEQEIEKEIQEIGRELGISIKITHEGEEIVL
jgi:ribonuclease BN (tRNA processing enzyme)